MPPLCRNGSDDYQTPPGTVLPLLPYLPAGTIWECACGKGYLVEGLRQAGRRVIATDKKDGKNFLTWQPPDWHCLVTNPPFSLKNEFLARAYDLGKPFAFLLPLTALESPSRQSLFRRNGIQVMVLDKRINFENPNQTASHPWFPVAWFCWRLDLPEQLTFVDQTRTTTMKRTTTESAAVNHQANAKQPDTKKIELLALKELDKKLLVARDRIRLVARCETPGFYWHGRPGTGKTHLVLATLDEMGVKYHYHKGHITAQGLLELIAEHPDEVIILDDVSVIFADKKAVQYLLAVLGRVQGQAWETSYVRQGQRVHVKFTGGIICISNLGIENKGMLAALRSRVHTLGHSPSDLMLIALARHRICTKGWPAPEVKVTADEVNEVINWVWDESQRLNVAVDLRVLFDKGLPDYLAWREKKTEAHWKDLVTTTLEEEVNSLAFTPPGGVSKVGVRQATKEEEWEIVRAILKEYESRRDRIWAWKQRVRKSEKAFDRRWAEIKAQDRSNDVPAVTAETSTLKVVSDG